MYNYPAQYPWNAPYAQRPQQQWYQPPAQPVQPQPMPPAQPVNAVMVTSRTEAEAAQIPFDPAVVSVFVDQAHSAIYVKRFNQMTGGADLDVYTRQGTPAQEPTPDPVVTQLADLARRVEALENRKSGQKEAET